MKFRLIAAFVFFGITFNLSAQITGRVVDIFNEGVAFANITIHDTNQNILITGALSDVDGYFSIDFSELGNFTLQVSLLSYESWVSETFVVSEIPFEYSFPPILLKEEVTQLEGVSVRGQRQLIQRTQDGSVINVQASVMTKGSNALRLLERSPGVILDQYNNTFSLNGKSGTLIMINGKAQRIPIADLIAMLNGMSADNIEKIELLTNPSARYDVDGNAGIINIVTSKNEYLGLQGNLNVSSGYGVGPKQTTSFSINYGGASANFFGTYTFSYDDTFSGFNAIGTTEIPVLGGSTSVNLTSRTKLINRNHNFNLGYERQLSEVSTWGANILLNTSKPLTLTKNRGLYKFTGYPYLDAQISLNGDGILKNLNISSFYEITNEDDTFAITADYIKYTTNSPNMVKSSYFDKNGVAYQPENEIYNLGNRGFNETDIKVGVVKLDYKHQFNENLFVESGLKGSISKTLNDASIEILQDDEFVPDERFISTIENEEQIGAIYAILDSRLSEKTRAQIGLRYEYWNQDFDDSNLNRSFGKAFPTVFITHSFSDTTALNISYNKRITRPNYADIASFLVYNSPTSVFSGNPQLLPAISDNININYNLHSFSVGLLASNEVNPIARFQVTRNSESNLAVIAPVNLDYQRSLDFQTNIPIRIASWWNINFNATIGFRKFKLLHTDNQITHDYLHYNFNGSQTIQLPKNISLELSGWYTSEHFNGSTNNKGFGTINGGLKKEFRNGGSLQFSVTDIFESMNIRFKAGTITREAFGDEFDVTYSPESGFSRIFTIGYTYPFGNKKVKQTSTRTGADTEKSRIAE
ncbi:outer membrane beta-barrel protein [Aurantibacter sp.]|uniref:outer membrane beta-barrel protein n=1 Tax=Aurantibacter sp. TaxID=2807103 RepID=UPI0032642387